MVARAQTEEPLPERLMAQRMVECARCKRVRPESRMETIHTHGVTFSLCLARTTCRTKRRENHA
jgi:hypothetical protein